MCVFFKTIQQYMIYNTCSNFLLMSLVQYLALFCPLVTDTFVAFDPSPGPSVAGPIKNMVLFKQFNKEIRLNAVQQIRRR